MKIADGKLGVTETMPALPAAFEILHFSRIFDTNDFVF